MKKKMIPLTDKEKETHENQKICYMCEKEFCTDENNKKEFKLIQNSEIIVITQENTEELLIVFAI